MINQWTQEEINVLRNAYNNGLCDDEISNIINRTSNSIRSKRRQLGLVSKNFTPKWSDEQKELLKTEYYSGKSVKELSVILGKTEGSIRGMKGLLGLRGQFKPFTDLEKQLIEEFYKQHVGEQIDLDFFAKQLGRQKTSISRYAKKLGLTDIARAKGCYGPSHETMETIYPGIDYGAFYNNVILPRMKSHYEDYHNSSYYNDVVLPKLSKATHDYFEKNGHPRGMLGKHHTDITKQKIQKFQIQRAENMTEEEKHDIAMKAVRTKMKNGGINTSSNAYSRCRGGKRKDLNNLYFRSAWEANIARLFNYFNLEWSYEIKRFIFIDQSDGVLSYQPDFYLPQLDIWVEVKGWMDKKSIIRLNKFQKEYPNEYKKLIIIGEKEYNVLNKQYNTIRYWE